MRVTIEIPNRIAADLKRVVRRSQLSQRNLSVPEIVATCVAYSLSPGAKHPDAEKRYADLALKLIAMQPRSHE